MSAYYEFKLPTKILSGDGALEHIPHELEGLGASRPLLLSDQGLEQVGTVKIVQEALHQGGMDPAETFCRIPPDSSIEVVNQVAALFRGKGCDSLIALGGGSVIDTAKGVGMVLAQAGSDLLDAAGCEVLPRGAHVPFVAIPTTAGTGTEVDAWTVVTNEATNEKMSGGNKTTFPVLSIVDPDFMLSVPPKFTAFQGFDALFHSTESYINKNENLMRDMLALKAIESVGRNLAAACANGQDKKARELVAFGSSLSGMVMSVDNLCSEHSLEHPLSAYHPAIAHGEGLIMVSKAYYTHFVEHCPELHDRFIDMAKAMGKEDAKDPMDFVTALVDLQKACGVDNLKMSDYGITPEEFPKFVSNARSTMGILFKLDRIQLSDEDLVKIYTESYR